uniref:Protein zer-1 homolog-like C-terminal domain-containing protein n=1 Tax=Periophthalmus magnuspinnatus TaxID=409849 RepID=A0A3B4B4B9_9GOBI
TKHVLFLCLQLVVLGMRNHPATLNVQLAASACVFNLTKTFPNHQQVFCILMFNFTEKLPLQSWLCNHEDQNMQRMAVAIISILAAKLSTEQTAQLGAELFIVKQLLHIVRQKATQGVVDATLKFTLSALWNLTDESPTTCRHFIENQGLDLFIKVLESFPNESSIQQKVLGLLNNIAEVAELHGELMVQGFLDHISTLLHSSEVEVSYFAHLTSRGEESWTLSPSLRSTLLEQLHNVITKWPPPECEMVAYRMVIHQNPGHVFLHLFSYFTDFFPPIFNKMYFCLLSASRYCSMLLEEGGLQQLEQVQAHPQTHKDVKMLAESILESLQRHRARTGQPVNVKQRPKVRLQLSIHLNIPF